MDEIQGVARQKIHDGKLEEFKRVVSQFMQMVRTKDTRYAYRLTDKGVKVALLFVIFYQRLCGPLANSLFHHRPEATLQPDSKLEAAVHKADNSIRNVIQLREGKQQC